MNLRRLFVLIPKINQVLFLLVLLGGIGGVLVGWFTSRGPDGVKVPEVGAAATAEPVAARLSFADPEAIRGSAVLMLRLSSLRGGAMGRLSSSDGYGGDLRNVLFLLGNEAQPRWLFKNHQNLLRHVEQISGDPDDPEEGDAAAIYLEYASADTNGDQRLTHADRFSVALAHPDGTELQVLLADVDRVFKHTVLEDDQFVVIYQKAEVLRQARFNLKTGKLQADQELVKVPQAL